MQVLLKTGSTRPTFTHTHTPQTSLDMPIAVPEKVEPMTPIKTLSAEKKEGTGVEGPVEVKVETNKADGIKVDEVDLKGECP